MVLVTTGNNAVVIGKSGILKKIKLQTPTTEMLVKRLTLGHFAFERWTLFTIRKESDILMLHKGGN